MVKSLPESFLSWKGSSLWRGFVIDKYKSWVTAAGNLEKRGMNNAEIASILGISARFVFRIIPAIDFDGLCSKLQKHNGLFFKLNMIQFYILYGDEFKIIRQLSA